MTRRQVDTSGTSWSDVGTSVQDWETFYGVRICAQLFFEPKLSTGGCVEVVIWDGNTVGRGAELVRTREAFPARKGSGHAGAVLWAVSSAVRLLEAEPWQWSTRMRTRALKQA